MLMMTRMGCLRLSGRSRGIEQFRSLLEVVFFPERLEVVPLAQFFNLSGVLAEAKSRMERQFPAALLL